MSDNDERDMEDAIDQLAEQLTVLSEAWDRRLIGFVKKAADEMGDGEDQDREFLNVLNMIQTHSIAWVASDMRALVHSVGMYQQARKAAVERVRNYQLARLEIANALEAQGVELIEITDAGRQRVDELIEEFGLDPCANPKCPVHGPQIRDDTKENN